MQNVNCYLCEANDFSVIFPSSDSLSQLTASHLGARKGNINQAFSHNWVRCNICGLVYANPVPSKQELDLLYASSNQSSYNEEEGNLSYTYGRYLDKYRKYILNTREAIDIGAGRGFFVKTLKQYGFERVTGIEPSKETYESAPGDIRPFLLNRVYDEADFQPNSFDLISCLQTLEHVHNPNKLIESFSRLLSKNGIAFCVAHNFSSFGVKILGAKHPIVNAGHLTLFDKVTLSRMFAKHLEVIDVFSVSNRYSLKYWISLLPLKQSERNGLEKVCASLGVDKMPLSMKLGNIGLIARRL